MWPLCFVCELAHLLRDLLSSLQICKRVVHDILKKLLAICETVFTFLCDHCPNCRTVVSLGRSILVRRAGALKIRFWGPVAKMVLFYYTAISNLSISGSRDSLGPFRPPDGLQIWFWVPVAKVVLFYCTAISNLSISGSWGSLGCFEAPRWAPNLVLGACRQSGTFLLHCC